MNMNTTVTMNKSISLFAFTTYNGPFMVNFQELMLTFVFQAAQTRGETLHGRATVQHRLIKEIASSSSPSESGRIT